MGFKKGIKNQEEGITQCVVPSLLTSKIGVAGTAEIKATVTRIYALIAQLAEHAAVN